MKLPERQYIIQCGYGRDGIGFGPCSEDVTNIDAAADAVGEYLATREMWEDAEFCVELVERYEDERRITDVTEEVLAHLNARMASRVEAAE